VAIAKRRDHKRQGMRRIVEPPPAKVIRKKIKWKLWLILFLLVFPAVVVAAYTWLSLHYTYSSGERTGYVQKISKKGWICKTWEGELAMTTVPGTAPQIFQFTVRDDATAHQIEQATGSRAVLSYQQHRGIPTSCFGETEYFVIGIRTLGR
jgi:hypothetical protein